MFGSGVNSHTWGFYDLGPDEGGFNPLDYFYTLTIAGDVPFSSSFVLEVQDHVVPQETLPGGTCVTMRSGNRCSYFDVRLWSGTLDFPLGFTLTIAWYDMSGGLTSASILRAADYVNFTGSVAGTTFTSGAEPEIAGHETELGRFAVVGSVASVPEPGTTLPLAMLAALILFLAGSRSGR